MKTQKQMKVFLNRNEHAVLVAAAQLKGLTRQDYMKKVVMDQAKKDSRNEVTRGKKPKHRRIETD